MEWQVPEQIQGSEWGLVHVKPSGFANWCLSKLDFYPPAEAGRLGPIIRCRFSGSLEFS